MVALRESRELAGLEKEQTHSNPSLSADSLYQSTLFSLRRRLSLFVWQGFFEPLKAHSLEGNTLCILAPTAFHRDWLIDHYLPELNDCATHAAGRTINVQVKVQEEDTQPQHNSPLSSPPALAIKKTPVLVATPQATTPLSDALTLSSPHLGQSIKKTSLESFRKEAFTPLKATPIALRSSVSLTPDKNSHSQAPQSALFNPSYTFETFVPGPSNEVAYSASKSVSENPGGQYCPLFVFGGAGLGKTHLLHAIGNAASFNHPHLRMICMSAEQWVNAYIQAIRERRFDAFRDRFRVSCDFLLIDDVQFLAGKDASQDEFFHTFNTLHQCNKQIVVTSDKYPHEIEGLEERLKTRLSWGLVVDVKTPDITTRIAILERKAEILGIALPEEVALYLASNVTTSVRELEGALIRLSAFTQLNRSPVTVTQAQEYLSPVFRKNTSAALSSEDICKKVGAYFDIKPADLGGQSRQRQVTLARQIAMALCRKHLAMSYPEIGRLFGGRDHTTVMSSLRKIEDLLIKDVSLRSRLESLEKDIHQIALKKVD